MRTDLIATVAAAALLLVPKLVGAQSSAYRSAPFREHPVEVAQAAALERITVAARAIAVGTATDEDDSGEDRGPLVDFGLLQASLAAASAELEEWLAAAIADMVETAAQGKNAAQQAEEVIRLAAAARGELVQSDIVRTPAFRAALMASLLLDDGGVAEGYEEATAGEGHAYRVGYFALQRVKSLWEGLAGQASAEQAAGVEAMLAALDGLFPAPDMPDGLSPDPEQAEAPAQQLVGLLEGVADAELYLGRDLAAAARVIHDLAADGCPLIEAGKAGLGVEALRIATAYYARTLHDTLGLLAPEAAAAIEEGFKKLEEADEATQACGPLLEALAAGKAALTP